MQLYCIILLYCIVLYCIVLALIDSQWHYQEQPEHAQISYLTKRLQFNAKYDRNFRDMGLQGLEKPH